MIPFFARRQRESRSKSTPFPQVPKMMKTILIGGFVLASLGSGPHPIRPAQTRPAVEASVRDGASRPAARAQGRPEAFDKVLVDEGVLFVE
jgi:hypothetical protein